MMVLNEYSISEYEKGTTQRSKRNIWRTIVSIAPTTPQYNHFRVLFFQKRASLIGEENGNGILLHNTGNMLAIPAGRIKNNAWKIIVILIICLLFMVNIQFI